MLSKIKNLREEREQGFTLIELLVVILIIGILSAIAIPVFMNQRKSAVDATVQSDVANVAKQIDSEAVKNAHSPVQDQEISNTGVSALAFISPIIIPKETKVSSGTVVRVYGNGKPGEYCVVGVNLGGDVSKDGISYDSLAGGLNKSGEACADDNADSIADRIPEVVLAAENLMGGGGAVEAPVAGDVLNSGTANVENGAGERSVVTYTVSKTMTNENQYGNQSWSYTVKFSEKLNGDTNYGVAVQLEDGSVDYLQNTSALSNGTITGSYSFYKDDNQKVSAIIGTMSSIPLDDGGWLTFDNTTDNI